MFVKDEPKVVPHHAFYADFYTVAFGDTSASLLTLLLSQQVGTALHSECSPALFLASTELRRVQVVIEGHEYNTRGSLIYGRTLDEKRPYMYPVRLGRA